MPIARPHGSPMATAALGCALWAGLTALPAGTVRAQLLRPPVPTTQALAALGLLEKSLPHEAKDRWFLVAPPGDGQRLAPVLLVLHGGTQSMRRMFVPGAGATLGWPELARRENALLLVPNGVNASTGNTYSDNQTWNDLRQGVSRASTADDVGFILALVQWAHRTYRTDPRRVYVTGASNGGMMTFRLLMEAPDRFAAGAAFVAALPVDARRIKRPGIATPLLIANGTLDPLVQWSGGRIAGNRGQTRSVAETIRWWVGANNALPEAGKPELLAHRDANDPCVIERRVHRPGPGGAPVEVYTMRGGGHTMPSIRYPIPDTWIVRRFIGPVCRDIEGTELAWSFLSAQRRPEGQALERTR